MLNKLFIILALFLASCAPQLPPDYQPTENAPAIVTKNIGDGISIFHDDERGVTCYIIESQIETITYMVGGSGNSGINYIKSISCVSDFTIHIVE